MNAQYLRIVQCALRKSQDDGQVLGQDIDPRRCKVNGMMTRRDFVSGALLASAGALAQPVFAAKAKERKMHVGHTGITWSNDHVEDAVAGISSLGFYGFETFGDILVKWEDRGGLGPVLEKNKLALISGY